MALVADMGAHQLQQHQEHQHQHQHQHPQRSAQVIDDTKTTTTVLPMRDITSKRPRTVYSLDDVSTASAAPARPTLLNPWRALDREDFVITYAAKGTARCIACLTKIKKGELQLGAFYMHEDKFMLVRWYHQRCVEAPECLKNPMDLCGIEDIGGRDLDRVLKWLGGYALASVKERTWTA